MAAARWFNGPCGDWFLMPGCTFVCTLCVYVCVFKTSLKIKNSRELMQKLKITVNNSESSCPEDISSKGGGSL